MLISALVLLGEFGGGGVLVDGGCGAAVDDLGDCEVLLRLLNHFWFRNLLLSSLILRTALVLRLLIPANGSS